MTAVSDVFAVADGAAIPVGIPYSPPSEDRDVQARRRARVPTTVRDGKRGRLRSAAATVRADVSGAWVWRGTPPSPLDLWRQRIPARERVPGQNWPLWAGWIAWNHAVLVPFAILATGLWIAMHPARAGLAAVVAAPLIGMWIS